MDEETDGLQRRAREVFDASVDGLDAEVRSRLGRARREAVAAVAPRRRGGRLRWLPVAAVAATVLVAVALWRLPQTVAPGAVTDGAVPEAEVVELVADGDDLDLVENDLEFYVWLDVTGFDAAAGAG